MYGDTSLSLVDVKLSYWVPEVERHAVTESGEICLCWFLHALPTGFGMYPQQLVPSVENECISWSSVSEKAVLLILIHLNKV